MNKISDTEKYLNTFVCAVLLLFLIFIVMFIGNPTGAQLNIFHNKLSDIFADYFNLVSDVVERDPYFLHGQSYLPFALLPYLPFAAFENAHLSYDFDFASKFMTIKQYSMMIMGAFVFISFMLILFIYALNKIIAKYKLPWYIILALMCNYIVFYSFERGNNVFISVVCIYYFLLCYDSEDHRERILAMAALAIAATIKIYPCLFGLLYFRKRQYKEIFISASITLFLVFMPFLFFKNGFSNIPQLFLNVRQAVSILPPSIPSFNIKYVACIAVDIITGGSQYLLNSASLLILLFTAFLITTSVFLLLISKNKWVNITLAVLVVLYLPPHSFMYNGMYLFVPMLNFFNTLPERSRGMNIFIIIVFCIILNPIQIVFSRNDSEYSINWLFMNIAILSLWITLLIDNYKKIASVYFS